MYDTVSMAVGNSIYDLFEVDSGLFLFEEFFFSEKSEKFSALKIFHNHDNFHVT